MPYRTHGLMALGIPLGGTIGLRSPRDGTGWHGMARHGTAWHGMAGALGKPDSGPDQRRNGDCPIIDFRRLVGEVGAPPTPAAAATATAAGAAAAAGRAARLKGHSLSRRPFKLNHLEIRRVHPSPEGREEASNFCNKGSDGMARNRPQVIMAMRYGCA
jgi:hypothetical protein